MRVGARKLLALAVLTLTFSLSLAAQGPLPPEGRIAQLNGIEMYYEVYGQGPPLVLLHGFGGSGLHWKPFITDFAKEYQVIVPDLRGHGRSTNPTNQFSHRQAALDVYALLDRLQIKQFKAMGISTGGMTLIHMATQQPERPEAMVLVGATIYFPEQARAIMRRITVDSMTPQELEVMRRFHFYGDEQIRALRNQMHNFKDSYDDMNFTKPFLSTIQARTLIVHGDRDEFFPVSIPIEEYTSIPKSYLWIIPNGGHVPIIEHSEEFTKLALGFLRGEWEKTEKE